MASFKEAKAHLRLSSLKKLSATQSYTLVLQHDAPTTAAGAAAEGSSNATTAAATAAVYRKVSVRLLPLFMTMLVLNWLDRSCLAFASIQMTQELHFTPEVYGLAAGFFFLPYCLLQVRAPGGSGATAAGRVQPCVSAAHHQSHVLNNILHSFRQRLQRTTAADLCCMHCAVICMASSTKHTAWSTCTIYSISCGTNCPHAALILVCCLAGSR
eukprot:GHRQ01011699.1.p1 GENE.GHRQ01011699.1~~GHRQ01011699.1.p1  ORF type:complete len:213 (+),score=54.74 GHRQ01011699.1:395-1033(+)